MAVPSGGPRPPGPAQPPREKWGPVSSPSPVHGFARPAQPGFCPWPGNEADGCPCALQFPLSLLPQLSPGCPQVWRAPRCSPSPRTAV